MNYSGIRTIFFFLFIVALCSCSKKKMDDPFVLQFQKITDKYFICDSIRTTTSGVTSVQVLGKGKGEDLMFHNDATFTVYSSPAQQLGFELESPDKLYYYDQERDPDVYFTVTTITDNVLVLKKFQTTSTTLMQYYHAE